MRSLFCVEQAGDLIQDDPREVGFGEQRQGVAPAVGVEDDRAVGVDLEPGVGLGDVVADDEVEALAPAASRRRAPPGRRSRPRTPPAPGPAGLSRPRSTRKSWVGSSTISGMPSCFLSLRFGGSLGRKSATAAAITTTSARRRPAHHCVLHLGRGLHRHDLDARRRGPADGGDEGDVGAAAGGHLGDGVALLARRAVGDDAHRVDGLAGAAGGHEHPHPGEVVRARGCRSAAATMSAGSARRPSPTSPPARRPGRGVDHVDAAAPQRVAGSPAPRRAPTSRCAWPAPRAPAPGWRGAWR